MTLIQREHIEALCEALFQLYRLDAIGLLPNNIASWISDDVELVEVRFLCNKPDSDYQHEVADEWGVGHSYYVLRRSGSIS